MADNRTAGQKQVAASVNTAIEVNGLTELVKAFRQLDKETKKELQKELREVAKPAADRARGKTRALGLSKKTVTGIRPGSRLGMAVVRQSRKSGTLYKRPLFAPFQLARVLEPAAAETMPEAREQLEAMLDRLAAKFNQG